MNDEPGPENTQQPVPEPPADQAPSKEPPSKEPPARESRPAETRRGTALRFVIVGMVALGAGYLLAWLPAWRAEKEHAKTVERLERRSAMGALQNILASAAIDARRGEYEAARQLASRFFTELRAEVDRGPASVLANIPRENIEPLFAQRDLIITLLARSDPASADRLSDLHVAFRKVVEAAGLAN